MSVCCHWTNDSKLLYKWLEPVARIARGYCKSELSVPLITHPMINFVIYSVPCLSVNGFPFAGRIEC